MQAQPGDWLVIEGPRRPGRGRQLIHEEDSHARLH
jgi:hypothetical protein